MLEKPAVQDAAIIACLRQEYGLAITRLEFLPLGADRNTAVYRAVTGPASAYFVKLRGGVFDEMPIIVPRLLHDQGIQPVIAPIATRSQQLWTRVDDFTLAVFPFIEGHDGYEVEMQDHHWLEFGRALKAIHAAELDPAITQRIRRETYSDQWRESVKRRLKRLDDSSFDDPIAAELVDFLKREREVITQLVRRAEALAAVLPSPSPPFVLCHADIHAANILIDTNDVFYIVDWDTLTLAPKERDLMFVGGGQFLNKRSAQAEEKLFYQGYGQVQTDPRALAYYRYERIVQDIAEFCDQILLTEAGAEDRARGLRLLAGQFLPGEVVDITFRADKNSPPDDAT